jgi:hypothetical protein
MCLVKTMAAFSIHQELVKLGVLGDGQSFEGQK